MARRIVLKLRFEKKMTVFWYVAPCGLEEVYRLFRGAYYLHNQGDDQDIIALMM
jgi:hypothetical protein